MSNKPLTQNEIVKIAAEAGAQAGIDRYEAEMMRQRRKRVDTRLRNTKHLMRHYREIAINAEDAIASLKDIQQEDFDFFRSLMEGDARIDVQAIVIAKARSAIMLAQVNTAIATYGTIAMNSPDPTEIRRYNVLVDLYIGEEQKSAQDIADREGIDVRTVYRDSDAACEKLSALLFGVQAVVDT